MSGSHKDEIPVQNLFTAESAEPFREIVAAGADAIVGVNTSQKIVLFNRAAEVLFGVPVADMIGQPLTVLLPKAFRAEHAAHVDGFRTGGAKARYMAHRNVQLTALRADGTEIPVAVSIQTLSTEDGPLMVAQVRDISERMEMVKEQIRLANRDPLTDALNRRAFFNTVETLNNDCAEEGPCYSVLLVDLDHFKLVNDRYGHASGDGVLQSFSEICSKTLRTKDIFARWGGEEFVALLPETDIKTATKIGERIRRKTEKYIFKLPNGEHLHQTVSIGVAVSDAVSTRLDDVIRRADSALYAAKNAGRNCIRTADTEMTTTNPQHNNPKTIQ